MNNKIGLTLLQIANMFYKKHKTDELETATAALRLLLQNEDPELYDEIKKEVIMFATKKSTDIKMRSIAAFDYEPEYTDSKATGISGDNKKKIFQKFIVIAREVYNVFDENEKNAAWKKVEALIYYCAQSAILQK